MVDRIEQIALSKFESSSPYNRPDFHRKKAKVGLMKDEGCGQEIIEFVGLRPKIYS